MATIPDDPGGVHVTVRGLEEMIDVWDSDDLALSLDRAEARKLVDDLVEVLATFGDRWSPAERLAALVATLPAYPNPSGVWPADVAREAGSPAAAGDDTCVTCGTWETVVFLGECGVREPVNIWRCARCGASWSTRVRRAAADLDYTRASRAGGGA